MKQIQIILFFLTLPFVSHAQIYKCTSDEGLTIYKGEPCNAAEKLKQVINSEKIKSHSGFDMAIKKNSLLGKNLLLNSSFEKQLLDWRVPLGALWTNNGGVNNSGALVMQAQKPPEDKYIHETKLQQCVVLGDGEKFRLSADFRYIQAPKKKYANRANVVWYTSRDCSKGGQYGGYIEPKRYTQGWQKIQRNNLKPSLGAKSALISVVQRGRYTEGKKALWDNIRFEVTEVFKPSANSRAVNTKKNSTTLAKGENYLLNGSFKNNLKSWRHNRNVTWSGIFGDKHAGAAKVDAISTRGSIGSGAFSQCVNIGNNKKFVLGGSFKRDENSAQKGDARIRLTWYGGKNCTGRGRTDTHSKNPKNLPGWQRLYIDGLQAPTNTQSALVEIIKVVSGKGKFTAYWDDIYLKAIE